MQLTRSVYASLEKEVKVVDLPLPVFDLSEVAWQK